MIWYFSLKIYNLFSVALYCFRPFRPFWDSSYGGRLTSFIMSYCKGQQLSLKYYRLSFSNWKQLQIDGMWIAYKKRRSWLFLQNSCAHDTVSWKLAVNNWMLRYANNLPVLVHPKLYFIQLQTINVNRLDRLGLLYKTYVRVSTERWDKRNSINYLNLP